MDDEPASDDDTVEFEIEVVSSSSSASLNDVDKIDNDDHHQHHSNDVNANQTNLPEEQHAEDANQFGPADQKERQFNEVEPDEENTSIEIINQLEVVVNEESIASQRPLVVDQRHPEKPIEGVEVVQEPMVTVTVNRLPTAAAAHSPDIKCTTSMAASLAANDQQVECERSAHNSNGDNSIDLEEPTTLEGREIPHNLDLENTNQPNDKEAAELSLVGPEEEQPAEVEVILVERGEDNEIEATEQDKQIDLTFQPSDHHLQQEQQEGEGEDDDEGDRDDSDQHQQETIGNGHDEKETSIESNDIARDANQADATFLHGSPQLKPPPPPPQLPPVESLLKSEPVRCPADWSLFESSCDLQITMLDKQPAVALDSPRPLEVPPGDDEQESTSAGDAQPEVSSLTLDEDDDTKAVDDSTGQINQLADDHQESGQLPSVDILLSSSPPRDELSSSLSAPSSPPPALKLDVSLPGRQRRLSVVFGDDGDLEKEFDEEPEFERRQVEVKRNRNPRDEYTLADELGRGRFGTVYKCTEASTGRQLAAKFVHMRRKEDRQDVEREVKIMSILQHKRLLQLYDAFDDGLLEMCLITELVEGGELFERIVDDDFELTEKKAAIFMRQICEGVAYMHSENIVHLDMKPENILCISRTGNRIKLIDFGLARQLSDEEPLRVMFGTPDFAAPEVLGYELVTLATDMWSVGVICYVLLSGLSPFMGDNDMETMANVTRAVYDFDSQAFEPISDLAKDFISKLLLRNASERLKPSECLQHPWLARGGVQLEAAVRERRESAATLSQRNALELAAAAVAAAAGGVTGPPTSGSADTTASVVSLDKRNLKKYVVRRKWHKTVHAIMALGRMGAFKQLI